MARKREDELNRTVERNEDRLGRGRVDSRKQELLDSGRRNLKMKYRTIMDIPESEWPAGKQYYGLSMGVFKDDLPSDARMSELALKGFTPVPADRHPEFSVGNMLGIRKNEGLDRFLHQGNILIVERDIELYEEEREDQERENAILTGSLQGIERLQGDPLMPMRNFGSKVYHTRESDRSFAG